MKRRKFLQTCFGTSILVCGCSDRRDDSTEQQFDMGKQSPRDFMIDIEGFVTAIADATRIAFNSLQGSTRQEPLYGFCLYTVDDLAGIVPSASAETGFMERKEKVLANQERLAWLKEVNIDVNRFILGDYRWNAYEWEFEGEGGNAYAEANRMLAEYVAKAEARDNFSQLTAEVLASLTIALCRLRTENLFDREMTTLYCSKPSSSDAGWLESESARILNTPAQFESFDRERIEWIKEEGDDDQEPLPIYRRIVSQYCKIM